MKTETGCDSERPKEALSPPPPVSAGKGEHVSVHGNRLEQCSFQAQLGLSTVPTSTEPSHDILHTVSS